MARKLEQTAVLLLLSASVKIDRDVTIPAGEYTAVEQRFVTPGFSERVKGRTPAVYLLELTGEQLDGFGSEALADYASVEFDVTEFVRRGNILVGLSPLTPVEPQAKPH